MDFQFTKFQFESFAAFAEMAGHGPYVWGAYGVTAVVLVWLFLRPLNMRREVLRQVARDSLRTSSRESKTL